MGTRANPNHGIMVAKALLTDLGRKREPKVWRPPSRDWVLHDIMMQQGMSPVVGLSNRWSETPSELLGGSQLKCLTALPHNVSGLANLAESLSIPSFPAILSIPKTCEIDLKGSIYVWGF